MCHNDISVSTGQDISNLFKKFFSFVYGPVISTQTPDFSFFLNDSVDLRVINLSICVVFDGIGGHLKPKCSYGPDGIPSIILRNCRYSLAILIYLLFKLSP